MIGPSGKFATYLINYPNNGNYYCSHPLNATPTLEMSSSHYQGKRVDMQENYLQHVVCRAQKTNIIQ